MAVILCRKEIKTTKATVPERGGDFKVSSLGVAIKSLNITLVLGVILPNHKHMNAMDEERKQSCGGLNYLMEKGTQHKLPILPLPHTF